MLQRRLGWIGQDGRLVVVVRVRQTGAVVHGILVLVLVLLDAASLLKVESEVVEAFVPSGKPRVLHVDGLTLGARHIIKTEATPEDVVVAAANVRLFGPLLDFLFGLDAVGAGLEMVNKVLLAVVDGLADVASAMRMHRHVALPALQPVVLAIFMALPVILGSKKPLAVSCSASIRSCMALLVFSG